MKTLALNQQTFDATVANANLPVLVDFWAEWCGPCKMIAPVLEELAVALAGRAVIAKVNIDEFPELAARFSVAAIPMLIIFKNGQPVRKLTGIHSRREITATLAAA